MTTADNTTEPLQIVDEPCLCPSPGWCERHRFRKTRPQWRLCQQRPDYRQLWDLKSLFREDIPPVHRGLVEGEESQPLPEPRFKKVGLGDLAAAAFKLIGFKPCAGCTKRRAVLNKVRIPFLAKYAPSPPEVHETKWVYNHLLPSLVVPDHRWAVGVTTAYRSRPSLIQSLGSLVNAGWTDVRVFAEPGSTLPASIPGITVHKEVKGVFQNWRFALQTLVEEKPNADFYAVFQDDVIYARNLKAMLERDLWFADDIGFISPYRSVGKSVNGRNYMRRRIRLFRPAEEYLEIKESYREACRIGDGLWGALTYVFPRKSVDIILANEALKTRTRMIDLAIHPVLAAAKRRAWYYKPSLAEHISGPSSIGHGTGKGMYSTTFPGEDFDCMSLLKEGVAT